MIDHRQYCPSAITTSFSEPELVDAADRSIHHLLTYCEKENPIRSALSEIRTHYTHAGGMDTSIDFSRDVLHTLLIQALVRPNSYIKSILDAFRPQLAGFKHVIGVGLSNYAAKLGIDLAGNFLIIGPERFEIACVAYGVVPQNVLVEAIATDDADLFNLVCSVPNGVSNLYDKWNALARFEDAPSSRIMTQCLGALGSNHCFKIYKARASLLRETIAPTGKRQPYLLHNRPGFGPTLYPNSANQGWRTRADDADSFYRTPAFAAWIAKHPVAAIKSFFWPAETMDIQKPSQWETVEELTRIFLGAGVQPVKLLTHGLFNRNEFEPGITLSEALDYLGCLSDQQSRFYSAAYLAYLRGFTIDEIIGESRGSDKTLIAAHRALKDPALIQAMSSNSRDNVFSGDLGL